MRKQNEDKIRSFFERKLTQSGYVLENLVEAKLNSLFSKVDRDVSYIDKDESKGRRNDFVARVFIPDGNRPTKGKKAVVQLVLITEVKSLSDHGWIFFPGKDQRLALSDIVSPMKFIRGNDPAYKTIPITTFPKLFCAAGYAEYFLDNKDSQGDIHSNKRDSNLYESVHTVTKATRHQIEYAENSFKEIYKRYDDLQLVPVVIIFQPLIVFNGRMYSSEIINDEINLQSIKYAQIPKRYTSKFYDENFGFIHVVRFDALDEYLELLRHYYWSKSEYITKNQHYLLKLMQEKGVSWRQF